MAKAAARELTPPAYAEGRSTAHDMKAGRQCQIWRCGVLGVLGVLGLG